MSGQKSFGFGFAMLLSVALVLSIVPASGVQGLSLPLDSPIPPPLPNDDFDSATLIDALPFTDNLDTTQATWADDDPQDCTSNGSVWYAFTPGTDMAIEATTFGSDYDTVLSVYTGSRGALNLVPGACNDDYDGLQSRVVFNASLMPMLASLISSSWAFAVDTVRMGVASWRSMCRRSWHLLMMTLLLPR